MKHAAPIAEFFPWDQSPNPFLALLASADAAIVTGDSESMTAEAIAAGMPVYLAPVPTRISPRMAVEWSAAWLHALGGAVGFGYPASLGRRGAFAAPGPWPIPG